MKEVVVNNKHSRREEFVNLLGSIRLKKSSTKEELLNKRQQNAPISSNRLGHRRKKEGVPCPVNVLAAQTLKIASINGLGRLDKLEQELEDEINYENRSQASTRFGRFRQKGEHHLHSKIMLFFIVILNIIDTLLVMIGLILDFHFVSLSLGAKSEMLLSFTEIINERYNMQDNEATLLQSIVHAQIHFNGTSLANHSAEVAPSCVKYLNKTASDSGNSLSDYVTALLGNSSDSQSLTNICFSMYDNSNNTKNLENDGEVDHTLSDVAHKLHYCSISILSLLVIILILKLICFGKRFFKERMLIFDGLVTIISFVLDIVFTDGVTIFRTEQFVTILTLLFPWRVIRILNSLIAAVLDKHKLNLKILYTQKKKISRTLTETTSKMEMLHRHVETLQSLCSSRGIGEIELHRALSGEFGSNKNAPGGGLASMMALGKLAFQAADALAPISNGNKKTKHSESSPALSSQASSPSNSPIRSEFVEITQKNDNNNAILKNKNETDYRGNNSDGSDLQNQLPADPENVVIHINGSGPPREKSEADLHITNINLNMSDKVGDDLEHDSRL